MDFAPQDPAQKYLEISQYWSKYIFMRHKSPKVLSILKFKFCQISFKLYLVGLKLWKFGLSNKYNGSFSRCFE